MSLQWQLSRAVPPDTAHIGQAVLAPHNLYRQLGDRFDQLFPDERVFADLYDTQGRGAISPLLLALVTVFQMLEKVPDRTAAEFVASRIDWKYALHLPLTYPGFHFTDLYAFRTWLLEHDQARLLFDQLLMRLKALGLIQPKGKVSTDSTHVLAVVDRLSQLELVTESLRMALRAVLQVAPQWVETALPAALLDRYAGRQSEYGLSQSQVQEKLGQAGQDAFWFLAQIDRTAPQALRQLPEVETLRTVLEQQFPQGPSGPPAQRRPTGGEVIESPHEPEASYGKKRGQAWLGYKAQVSETCEDDQPHLIVDLEPTGALDNDGPELPQIQARLAAQGLRPADQYVDQGYMSGQHLVESRKRGIDLVGVPLADTQGSEGFRQADFQIDEEAQQAICPAGQKSTVWSQSQEQHGQVTRFGQDSSGALIVDSARTTKTVIRFAAATCQACPCFGRCTTSPQGRSLTLHPYRAALHQRRAEAQTEAYREKLHLRAGIEGTISELVRRYRLRLARYRGRAKLRLQAYFTALAANLNRLVRWWTQPQKPAQAAG